MDLIEEFGTPDCLVSVLPPPGSLLPTFSDDWAPQASRSDHVAVTTLSSLSFYPAGPFWRGRDAAFRRPYSGASADDLPVPLSKRVFPVLSPSQLFLFPLFFFFCGRAAFCVVSCQFGGHLRGSFGVSKFLRQGFFDLACVNGVYPAFSIKFGTFPHGQTRRCGWWAFSLIPAIMLPHRDLFLMFPEVDARGLLFSPPPDASPFVNSCGVNFLTAANSPRFEPSWPPHFSGFFNICWLFS